MRKCVCLSRIMLGLFVLTLGAAGAQADTATIAGTGVWGSSAPTSDWSAPGQTWSFSLTLPNPASATSLNGTTEMLVTEISSFSYTLGGLAVNIQPSGVVFFPSNEDGGLDIEFTAAGMDVTNGIACSSTSVCSFNVFGSLLFSGNAPTITIQSGLATAVDFDYTASGDVTNPSGTGPVSTFTVTPISTPEPATVSLLALGALGLLAKRRKKF
jgi:PEP-CTERM motif